MVSLAESAAFVAYEASSVASALAPWSAVMLASRLASCAATKASVARPSRVDVLVRARQRARDGGLRLRVARSPCGSLPTARPLVRQQRGRDGAGRLRVLRCGSLPAAVCEDCVKGALERGLAGRERGVRGE